MLKAKETMSRTLAFINEKGGSCKTTLTVNAAGFFALERKARVLLVDMDPQGHAGKALGIAVRKAEYTIHDLLIGDAAVGEVLYETRIPGLDIIIANKRFTDFAMQIPKDRNPYTLLRDRLAKVIRKYDYVLFDSPPSLGLHTVNIMNAVDEIVIPVNLTYFALDGCAEITDSVEKVKKDFKHTALEIRSVVPTLYRRTRMADAVLEKLREVFGERVSKTVIGYNVAVDEAQSQGKLIWEYAPNSPAAGAFRSLFEEVEAL